MTCSCTVRDGMYVNAKIHDLGMRLNYALLLHTLVRCRVVLVLYRVINKEPALKIC